MKIIKPIAIDFDVLNYQGEIVSRTSAALAQSEIVFFEPLIINGIVIAYAKESFNMNIFDYRFYAIDRYYDKYDLKVTLYGLRFNEKLGSNDYHLYAKLSCWVSFRMRFKLGYYLLSRLKIKESIISSGLVLTLYEVSKYLLKKYINN